MPTTTPVRSLLGFALWGTPLSALAFLAVAQFFTSWSGHVVSAWPAPEDAQVQRVLLVDEDRDEHALAWPAELVRELDLPLDASGIAPVTLPEGAHHTVKSPFRLYFSVESGDGHETVYTSSPRALGVGLMVWFLALAIRNMVVAGSPLQLTPRPTRLPQGLPAAGQVVPRQGPRPKKGPPPPRGRRRRR